MYLRLPVVHHNKDAMTTLIQLPQAFGIGS